MNGIYIHPNESFEKALRRFSRMCDKAGVLYEYKKTLYHEKPSEKKKRKKELSKNKRIKELKFEIKNYEDRRYKKKK